MTALKKGDIIIIISVSLALVISIAGLIIFSKQGSTVTIKQNNEIVYSESIGKDNTVTLDGNTVIIEDGFVYMLNASCKNQVCVNTGKISKKGESIICLPNKVTVEIS